MIRTMFGIGTIRKCVVLVLEVKLKLPNNSASTGGASFEKMNLCLFDADLYTNWPKFRADGYTKARVLEKNTVLLVKSYYSLILYHSLFSLETIFMQVAK